MLIIYAVVKELEHGDTHCFDHMAFYLRRVDAEADMKDLKKRGQSGLKVVPLEVKETYTSEE